MAEKSSPKHIVFFHPDLGIGGAERLVVDAAVGLQNRGHKVTIFTNHCDPQHCFDEARDGQLIFRNTMAMYLILNRYTRRPGSWKLHSSSFYPLPIFNTLRNTSPASPHLSNLPVL